MSGYQWGHDIRIQGKPEPGPKDDVSADWTRLTPEFFDTIGAQMLTGRAINEDDNGNTRPVAVVNEAFTMKFFGNQNPIGQHFGSGPIKNSGTYEIVGVVQNIHYVSWAFRDPARAMYYIPEAQTVQFDQPDLQSDELSSQNLSNIVIWAPGHPANIHMQVKKALAEVDPNLVIYDIQPYSRVIQEPSISRIYRQPYLAVWGGWIDPGGDWPLWRDCLWRGATHERDRRAHGAGRRPAFGDGHGAARSVPAGRHRIGDRDSGGHWSGISHVKPTLRSRAVESIAVGRCGPASWIGGAGRCCDPRAKSGKHRPYAGIAQRIIHAIFESSSERCRFTHVMHCKY